MFDVVQMSQFPCCVSLITLIQLVWAEGVGDSSRSRKWKADLAAMDGRNEIDGYQSEVVGYNPIGPLIGGEPSHP